MIFSLDNIAPSAQTQIRTLLRLRPIPQLPVWEAAARQLATKGFISESCILLDKAAQYYGKQVGRACAERVIPIPMNRRGRGLTSNARQSSHPAFFALRDSLPPLRIGNKTVLRDGSRALLIDQLTGQTQIIYDIFSSPATIESDSGNTSPSHWIAIQDILFITSGCDLILIDTSAAEYKDIVLPRAVLHFDSPINNICGPLDDDTFFVTQTPPMPVFSDICRLCRLDLDKIRTAWQSSPVCDIREIDAVISDIHLVNIEQTLRGDCIPFGSRFMTCAGGMQNREIRFIHPDGSWTTRFIHESRVIRILPTEHGPVSLDESGLAILWSDDTPVDDCTFDLSHLPDIFSQNIEQTDFSIDWFHKRLFLTITTPPQASLLPALKASHSCCITANTIDSDHFIKKYFPLKTGAAVMLADGSIHAWNTRLDCVSPQWQLPHICAETADWQALLNTRSPAIEIDPRIRMLDF